MPTRLALAAGVAALLSIQATPAIGRHSGDPSRGQIRAAIAAVKHSRRLWATVNICNTPHHRHVIGIRGQMPALGFRTSMSMNIEVEYWSRSQGRFELDPYAVKLVSLGPASKGLHQGGVIYAFSPPQLLSAVVTFRWTRRGKLLGKITRKTRRGAKDVDYSDPPGYSRATCRIK